MLPCAYEKNKYLVYISKLITGGPDHHAHLQQTRRELCHYTLWQKHINTTLNNIHLGRVKDIYDNKAVKSFDSG